LQSRRSQEIEGGERERTLVLSIQRHLSQVQDSPFNATRNSFEDIDLQVAGSERALQLRDKKKKN
jgi:hypothetical protein